MKIINFFKVSLFIFSFTTTLCAANESASTASGDFLALTIQPRPLAMGGAFTAVADDINSLYFNPAGMTFINQITTGLTYRTGVEDLNYSSFGLIYPLKQNQRSLGISFTLARQGLLDIFNPDGNVQTVNLGNSFWTGLAYSEGLIKNTLSFGVQLKMVHSELYQYKNNSFNGDIGLLFQTDPIDANDGNFRLGIVLQNIGQGIKYIQETESLPSQLKLGVAYLYPFSIAGGPLKFTLSCDLIKSAAYDMINVLIGGELKFHNLVALRIGYDGNNFFTNGDGDGFCTGLGVYLNTFEIDYALKIASSQVNSLTQSAGLILKF